MTTQHEFCWAVSGASDHVAATHFFGRLVEHLALGGEGVGSLHEVIQLFSPLEDRFDRLVLPNGQREKPPDQDLVRLTRTIFVSSNSFCTFMIVSACLGS
jgi:hypothetical protein